MRLLRHNEIYRSDVSLTSGKLDPECRLLNGSGPSYRTHQEEYALPIVCDEFRPGIPRSGWSPPEPVFASPARPACHGWTRERKRFSANGDLSLFKLSHLRGAVHETFPGFAPGVCREHRARGWLQERRKTGERLVRPWLNLRACRQGLFQYCFQYVTTNFWHSSRYSASIVNGA